MVVNLLANPADFERMTTFAGGAFIMGADDGAPAEAPRHTRVVRPFKMDCYLVTNAMFARFVAHTDYVTDAERKGSAWGFDGAEYKHIPGLTWRVYATDARGDHPVVLVSWNDAHAYATWCGKRLPTEAEWEFAVRMAAGRHSLFPWRSGDDPTTQCGAGCHFENTMPGTSPVGSFPPHAGVYDLVGNVWQWCEDAYSATAYADFVSKTSVLADPKLRVRRGGAWNVQQQFRLRCSNRGAYFADASAPNIGFRCVR